MILKPMISVICSSETLFFWTFLHIEKGVFSLPNICELILFFFNIKFISLDKVSKIKLIQDKNIFFDVKILDVLEFNDPIKNLILTNDWKTIDWRVE